MTRTAELFRIQGTWCGTLGSPLYAAICAKIADDILAGGPLAAVLEGRDDDPPASALALRLLGVVHRLALAGDAPALARHYPSAGGNGDTDAAWRAFHALAAERTAELRTLVQRPVQTNEVGRAAALLGGFLTVAGETGLPLRVLEVGTSAGLNLRWDQFRYEAADWAWGDPSSPVVLRDVWLDGRPPVHVAATVAERAGCDPAPVDPTTEEGRLTLLSYVWPDQHARLAALRGAIDVARRVPATTVRANAADWIPAQLAAPRPGVATVIFHSIVIMYFDQESRDRLHQGIVAAGERATPAAPIAYLRMEPGGEQAEVRLTTWPGGVERLVATTSFHGRDVCWFG